MLSWDIRSVSQRSRPHQPSVKTEARRSDDDVENIVDDASKVESCQDDEAFENGGDLVSSLSTNGVYHLILEGLDISYRIDSDANVLVEKVTIASHTPSSSKMITWHGSCCCLCDFLEHSLKLNATLVSGMNYSTVAEF